MKESKGVALVTGSSRGIGADIARRLAADGFAVACAATAAANAQAVADEIVADGGRAVAVAVEVTDPASIRSGLEHAESVLGHLTVLVNNAGIAKAAPVHELSIDDFDAVIDVNVRGLFACCHIVSAQMVERGTNGSIINIGSIAGINGFPGRAAYAASKAAVHQMTKVMAIDLAPHKIRVNCVAPGYIHTDMVQNYIDEGRLDIGSLHRRIPMGELGAGTDIANAVAWLVSDQSRYITGETILVDGGWHAYGHV